MKKSWSARGFIPLSKAGELAFPAVFTAVLSQRAPGEGHAQGILIMWARNADAARKAVRQHFGNYYAANAALAIGISTVDDISDLIPSGIPEHIQRIAAAANEGSQLLEFAIFSLHQTLRD